MKGIKEVLGIYDHPGTAAHIHFLNSRCTPTMGIIFINRKEHDAIHRAAEELKDIASNTGVETKKRAKIKAQRGKINQQAAGIRVVSDFLKKMDTAEEKEEAFAYAGIATGYANAMKLYGFITAEELQDVIEVIEQAGEKAANRVEAAKRPFLMRAIKKVVRV